MRTFLTIAAVVILGVAGMLAKSADNNESTTNENN